MGAGWGSRAVGSGSSCFSPRPHLRRRPRSSPPDRRTDPAHDPAGRPSAGTRARTPRRTSRPRSSAPPRRHGARSSPSAARPTSRPAIVLFTGWSTLAAEGLVPDGPFDCPLDRRSTSTSASINELAQMGGAGDFAPAYVIGHEVGHHVQNLAGTADEVQRRQQRAGRDGGQRALRPRSSCRPIVSRASGRPREPAQTFLEPGDWKRACSAAAAIGDDRLQTERGPGGPAGVPTHGSVGPAPAVASNAGSSRGQPESCDTFGSRASRARRALRG